MQGVHDRPLDLTEVEREPLLLQTVVDDLQRFQRAEIDFIDRRALQYHVLQAVDFGDQSVNIILQVTGIGEVEAFIHPQ